VPEESKVGKKLSDLTTRRVIILVLAIVFSVPIFGVDTYLDAPKSHEMSLSIIEVFAPGTLGFNVSWNTFIKVETALQTPLVYASVANYTYGNSDIYNYVLRSNE
jgi:hypothetical protein